MNSSRAMRIAALMGLLAVVLGAFGAHALRETLARNPTSPALWEKAVFYHFIHAVMLFVLATRVPLPRLPFFSFLIGIILFSGSLYFYAVTGAKWLVTFTPFGGASFMVGWICLLICPRVTETK
jgi:uncharacterized membrane protein YgdD (TMEM256/DUF423 family)